jgi:hypothetical protein
MRGMKVNGRCHCGQITFRAEVDPATVAICHCTDCQALSGTAYRVVVPAPAPSFELLSGTLTKYVKTAESGNKRLQAFCGTCGSPVYSAAPENTQFYSLRIGLLAERAELAPKKQIWCDSALPWSASIGALPKSARQ